MGLEFSNRWWSGAEVTIQGVKWTCMPVLAIRGLTYGVLDTISAAAAAIESLELTSQTMGAMEPFFCGGC
jgi:hypothetical protein